MIFIVMYQFYFVGHPKQIFKRDALTNLERLLVSSMLQVEEDALLFKHSRHIVIYTQRGFLCSDEND